MQFTPEDLVVTLESDSPFKGLVVDTELEDETPRVMADFRRDDAPVLPIGAQVQLAFSGASLPAPLRVRGIVVFRSEDQFRHRYQFQFGEEQRTPLSPVINRRGAVRVRPDAGAPVEVEVGSGKAAPCRDVVVNDISITGVSLLVARENEDALFSSWKLQMSIGLPGEAPIQMLGIVRYRRLSGSAIHYGIQFLGDEIPDYLKRQGRIAAYIRDRQVAMLRARRNSK